MPSVSPAVNFTTSRPKILIVLGESSVKPVREILGRYAHSDWEEQKQIQLLIRPDNLRRFAKENSVAINKAASKADAARVLIIGKIEHNERFGQGIDARSVNVFADFASFENGIPNILEQSSVDWRNFITARLRAWQHSVIDDAYVDAWLHQFEQLGVRWIGEYLLRTLDFWTSDRVKSVLGVDEADLENYDCICVKRQEAGKSADVLSNLLRKHIASFRPKFPINDFIAEMSDRTSNHQRVLFVEDSLLTGTEMTNFFSGLLGLKPRPGRSWPVAALEETDRMRNVTLELRFPVSTSLGANRLRQFLRENGLLAVRVSTCSRGFIEVLTNSGQQALENGTFFDTKIGNIPADPMAFLEMTAFRGTWRREAQRINAENFCGHIGRDLFAEYLRKKGYRWDEKKIDVCRFGMHGLGLNLAFSHSVPKASLPLLWADGRVSFDGSTLDWFPLFANAAL